MPPTRSVPPPPALTLTLCLCLVAIFLLQIALGGPGAPALIGDLGVAPERIKGEWWRLVSGSFLHLSWGHLILNLAALMVLGPPVERMVGARAFLVVWVVSSIGGAAVSCAAAPTGLSAGASGSVVGLMAAAIVPSRAGRVPPSELGSAFAPLVAALLVVNLAGGFMVAGVDGWAHVGGAAAGFLAASMLELQSQRTGDLLRRAADTAFWASVTMLCWTGMAAIRGLGQY